MIPSAQYEDAKEEVERLERALSKITIASRRMRAASTLDWLERSEVLKAADMNEELFMAVDEATMLVLTRVPGFKALQTDTGAIEVLVNSDNSIFQSYFAILTANIIRQARFYTGQRGAFDKNHARIAMMSSRLMTALQAFSYNDGKIINKAAVVPPRQSERIAYQ